MERHLILLGLGFYFRNRSCFSHAARKRLVEATFLPVPDYDDLVYMHASSQCLHQLDTVYHSALRFIAGCRALTHHCTLYASVQSPVAFTDLTQVDSLVHIYKAILGLLPSYLCSYISFRISTYCLRSNSIIQLSVPKGRTELNKHAFMFSAPAVWNQLQSNQNCSLIS